MSSSKELIGRGHQPPTLAGGALYLASRILGEKDKRYRLTLAQAADLFGTNKESVADASHHVASILKLDKFRGAGYKWW
jgi:transcription initiation factor TFIIIB Brf1 subunit/transcription initiation factor TFIIB